MKMKKIKRYVSMLLIGCMLWGITGSVYAKEINGNEEVWEETQPVPTTSKDGISAKASWGYGTISATNPLTGHPKAKANTYTYAGTAYMLWARIDVIDSESISTLGPEKTGYNVSEVSTSYLVSDTENCSFIGNHRIQDTASSGQQTATTYKDFY